MRNQYKILAERYEEVAQGLVEAKTIYQEPTVVDGQLYFGKYRVFPKQEYHDSETTFEDAVKSSLLSSPTLKNLNELEKVGVKFEKVYKGTYNSTAVYGKDPNGESFIYIRKAGTQVPPLIYYKTERAGSAADLFNKFISNLAKPPLDAKTFLEGAIEPMFTNSGRRRKFITRPDGKTDVLLGNVIINGTIKSGYTIWNYTAKEIPVKFGIVKGEFYIDIPFEMYSDWFPESIEGDFTIASNIHRSGYLTPIELLKAGIPEKVKGDTILTGPAYSSLANYFPDMKWNIYRLGPAQWELVKKINAELYKDNPGVNIDI